MFERGFKAWCERFAAQKRSDLGLRPSEPLDAFLLAKHLGIKVITPLEVPGLAPEDLTVLHRNDGKTPSCWSAVTIVKGDKVIVVLNGSHSKARQASDLMHELAHRIRGHQSQELEVSSEGLMFLKTYEKAQEDEADWLAGCLLLPRDALISIKRDRLGPEQAAARYGVSQRMLTYRLAMTGVNRQLRARA